MQENARVTAFTVSELLRENQGGWGGAGKLPPTQIRVNMGIFIMLCLQINNVRNPRLIRDKKTPCGNVQVPPNFYCAFLFLDPQKNKYQEIGELLKVFLGECRLKSKINVLQIEKKSCIIKYLVYL